MENYYIRIFEAVMRDKAIDKAWVEALKILDDGVNLPKEIEERIIEFVSKKNKSSFVDFALEVLRKNYLGSYQRYIKVVAFLVQNGWLDLNDGVLLLTQIPHVERRALPESYAHVVEVADLIFEDSNEGFMEVDEDDLLMNALRSVDLK